MEKLEEEFRKLNVSDFKKANKKDKFKMVSIYVLGMIKPTYKRRGFSSTITETFERIGYGIPDIFSRPRTNENYS